MVNPDLDIAFDVPATWAPQSADYVRYVAEDCDPGEAAGRHEGPVREYQPPSGS